LRLPTFYFRSVAGEIILTKGEIHPLYNLFLENSNFPQEEEGKEAKKRRIFVKLENGGGYKQVLGEIPSAWEARPFPPRD
jgi:hypothetical protein